MTWIRTLGTFEYILIGCFVVLYVLYIVRITIIARKMRSDMRSVFYKFFLRSFYFFLIIIALLGPSFGNVRKEIKAISREIYIITDLSLSMDATDIHPSRLEVAKQEIKKIINQLPSDNISLIGFTSTTITLCPPTFDRSALDLFVESINTNLTGSNGSDIGTGLKSALDQQDNFSKTGLNKIFILITDGEDFGEKAMSIAADLRKKNIHLLILGIGTDKGTKIPYNGTYKRDENGEFVISRLNSEKLKELSVTAEGMYYEINTNTNETASLIDKVKSIEGSVSDTREVDASANKYLYFLIAALFFIIIDVLITVRTVKI